jgi:hypothetical protein
MLRRIFGPIEGGRIGTEELRIGIEGLYNSYSLSDTIKVMKSRRMRWAVHVTCMREKRNAYKVLVRKPELKRLVRKTNSRWKLKMKSLWLINHRMMKLCGE